MEVAVFKDQYYDEINKCTEFYFTCPTVGKTLRVGQYSTHKWEELPKTLQLFLTENATIGCIYADKSLSALEREEKCSKVDEYFKNQRELL